MKRAAYTKPNSITQQACTNSVQTVQSIMQRIHISYDEWLLLLFETGCKCVELQEPDLQKQKELLQDVQYGFWAWWLFGFIQHDAVLLQRSVIGGYRAEKMKIIEYMRLEFLADQLHLL